MRPKVGDIRPGNGGNFVLVELQHPRDREQGWGEWLGTKALEKVAEGSLATPAAPKIILTASRGIARMPTPSNIRIFPTYRGLRQ